MENGIPGGLSLGREQLFLNLPKKSAIFYQKQRKSP